KPPAGVGLPDLVEFHEGLAQQADTSHFGEASVTAPSRQGLRREGGPPGQVEIQADEGSGGLGPLAPWLEVVEHKHQSARNERVVDAPEQAGVLLGREGEDQLKAEHNVVGSTQIALQ